MSTKITIGRTSGSGSSLPLLATIVLVVLKLANVQPVASWEWIWVLCPLWISLALALAGLVIFAVIAGIVLVGAAVVEKVQSGTRRRRVINYRRAHGMSITDLQKRKRAYQGLPNNEKALVYRNSR